MRPAQLFLMPAGRIAADCNGAYLTRAGGGLGIRRGFYTLIEKNQRSQARFVFHHLGPGVDGNLVTSRQPSDLPAFLREMMWLLALDMDAFFAAVEVRRRPELAGKPRVIGGRGDPFARGVVSTASYDARHYGIHSALPLRTAYRLCPEAVFLPVDYGEYACVAAEIKAILRQFSPILEDVGIDEAYLDLSRLPDPPQGIARAIKQRIRAATGLNCSIGIAPTSCWPRSPRIWKNPTGSRSSPKRISRCASGRFPQERSRAWGRSRRRVCTARTVGSDVWPGPWGPPASGGTRD